jgi:hypothetical protein
VTDALARCLDDLEARVDPEDEDRLLSEWVAFSEGHFAGEVFTPRRRRPRPPSFEWPTVRTNATLEDPEAMLLHQYARSSGFLATGVGAPLGVRANYGTSILPLLFGVEPFVMPDEFDTLPTSRPLHEADAIRRIVGSGPPDLGLGYGARVLEMGERFLEVGRRYPGIGRHVHVFHPDLQGPLDVCEVVWGSSIFYALYDEPTLVEDLLELVTDTYSRFLRAWTAIVPFRQGGNVHWNLYHTGNIMLRADSAMNLAPEQYDQFSRPYDQRLLDEFGGGAIHYCGRGDHFIGSLSTLRGLHAVQVSQPELNDMEVVLASTVDRGLKLLGLPRPAADEALARGRDLRGCVHCE